MKHEHILTFLAAAEELNFTHAARRLFLSQSAVSQQIRELEEDLGVSLFERRGRGLLLTPAGEQLRAHAKPIVRDIRFAREALAEFRSVAQGVIRVGASNTPGIYLLPYALGQFAKDFPGVRISLRVADGPALIRAMQDGELDLALMEDDPAASRLPGWEPTALIQDQLALVASPEHPWAKAGTIGLAQLAEHPIIFRQESSPTRRLILARIAAAGLDPDRLRTHFELGNTEAIKRAAMANLGAGWVSRYSCVFEKRAGWLEEVEVEGLLIQRPLWLYQPPAERSVPHQRRFAELLLARTWLPAAFGAVMPAEDPPLEPTASGAKPAARKGRR